MSKKQAPNPWDRHRAAIRLIHPGAGGVTPYRVGLSVGWSKENLPNPYKPGSHAEDNYREGIKYASVSGGPPQRWIDAFAKALGRSEESQRVTELPPES